MSKWEYFNHEPVKDSLSDEGSLSDGDCTFYNMVEAENAHRRKLRIGPVNPFAIAAKLEMAYRKKHLIIQPGVDK